MTVLQMSISHVGCNTVAIALFTQVLDVITVICNG